MIYGVLVDVDPPLADHVLGILREAGIDAYAEPLAGETGPYRDVRPPDRPTSRVYVDRARLADARLAVASELPALKADFHADAAARADAADMAQASADLAKASAADIDAAWSALVSGFHVTESPDIRDNAMPDSPVPDSPTPDDSESSGSGLSARLVREHSPGPAGPRDYDVLDDPSEERYVPPEPPPLPRPRDRIDVAAWAGTIGGPLLVILAFVFNLGGMIAGLGFLAFTAGFITVISRVNAHRDDDDNGAIV